MVPNHLTLIVVAQKNFRKFPTIPNHDFLKSLACPSSYPFFKSFDIFHNIQWYAAKSIKQKVDQIPKWELAYKCTLKQVQPKGCLRITPHMRWGVKGKDKLTTPNIDLMSQNPNKVKQMVTSLHTGW